MTGNETAVIGVIGGLGAGIVSIATLAIKTVTDKRKNGNSDRQPGSCALHEDMSHRVQSIEEALTGPDGLHVLVGRLIERSEITNQFAAVIGDALKKKE